MTTNVNDWTYTMSTYPNDDERINDELCERIENNYANDCFEYDERIHELMCELVARIDSYVQRDNKRCVSLTTIRNACRAYIETIINTHA